MSSAVPTVVVIVSIALGSRPVLTAVDWHSIAVDVDHDDVWQASVGMDSVAE